MKKHSLLIDNEFIRHYLPVVSRSSKQIDLLAFLPYLSDDFSNHFKDYRFFHFSISMDFFDKESNLIDNEIYSCSVLAINPNEARSCVRYVYDAWQSKHSRKDVKIYISQIKK